MALLLGDKVPNFEQDSTEGKIDLYDYLGDSWGILFSHPADYTPVCTTELGTVAGMKGEFDRRNVKVIGLSVDELPNHGGWVDDIEDTQNVKMNFPILADGDRSISTKYELACGLLEAEEAHPYYRALLWQRAAWAKRGESHRPPT